MRPAGWFALATAISPHAAFLGGTILLAVALLPAAEVRDLVRTAGIVASAAIVYGYAAVVVLTGVRTISVTQADLDAYATRAGPGGLAATVLSLHGFWRGATDDTLLPRDVVGPVLGWLLLALLVALVVVGLARLVRRDAVLGSPLVAVTVVGLLLGAGVDGPVGGLYRRGVRPRAAVRDDARAGEVAGADRHRVRRRPRRGRRAGDQPGPPARRPACRPAGCVVAAGEPWPSPPWSSSLVTAPVLLWGLGGRCRSAATPSRGTPPTSRWATAWPVCSSCPGTGYQPFSFTDGRTVATPGEAFFSRSVISSDAVELAARRTDSVSRRTAYLDEVVADAGRHDLGPLLAPLGIGWVVVAKDGDDPAPWVDGQPGIARVSTSPTLDLYQVVRSELSPRMRRDGATTFALSAGNPGPVLVPVERSCGWRLDGRRGTPTDAGTLTIPAGPRAGAVVYAPWRWLLPASVLSLLALAALLVAGLVEHRHDLARLLPLRRRRTPSS